MAKVDPVKSSIQTTDTVNGLEITIPAKLRIGVVLLMTFWLCLWAVGLVTAVMHLLSGRGDVGVILFMVVWLAIWIVGGAITMAGWRG